MIKGIHWGNHSGMTHAHAEAQNENYLVVTDLSTRAYLALLAQSVQNDSLPDSFCFDGMVPRPGSATHMYESVILNP